MRLTAPSEATRPVVVAYAVLAPLLVSATLAVGSDGIPHATVALALAVIIVGASATGVRWAGWGASLSSTLWFDWFHTTPRGSFAIDSAEDLQVAVLLLVVGGAVTELALWGQRWQASAAESSARLESLVTMSRSVADHAETDLIVHEVEKQLLVLLDLDRATWVPIPPGAGAAVLRRDGAIVRDGVKHGGRGGSPTDTEVALPVEGPAGILGRVDLIASAHISRPPEASLRVAFLLADQLAAAWSRNPGPRNKESAPHPDLV